MWRLRYRIDFGDDLLNEERTSEENELEKKVFSEVLFVMYNWDLWSSREQQ